MRTIKASSGRFTCMTTFGHRIAAVCDDGRMGAYYDHNMRAYYNGMGVYYNGSVGVYDSVTGALRLSLSPKGPVRALEGSPDGSVLFCAHQGPLITMWDIQTGGLIHTFDLGVQVECIAICSKGRSLACGLSDGALKILDVANKTDVATSGRGSPVTHLCWLELDEEIVVVRETSVDILDVTARTVLRSFTIQGRICGVVYAQKLNKFAIASTSETKSTITIIDPGTGTQFTTTTSQRISCLAFSQVTTEFVCGTETPGTPGLELFSVAAGSWRAFGHPATITSISVLSSGTAIANVAGSGIQLLSLDEGHVPPQYPTTSALAMRTFDEGKLIAILPTTREHIKLIEPATMSTLSIIPVRTWSIPTDRPPILCASLERRIVVCGFEDRNKTHLELWRFGRETPEWIGEASGLQLVGGISPGGSWLVVVEGDLLVRLYRTGNGICIGELDFGRSRYRNSDFKFESEDRFSFDHGDERIHFIISQSTSSSSNHHYPSFNHHYLSPNHPYSIRQVAPSLAEQPRKFYNVDDAGEWVTGSSKRFFWVPPGHIGSANRSYGWAGDTFIVSGDDGALRKITFRKSS